MTAIGNALASGSMLAGSHNFRDLGGLPIKDGPKVAYGQIFRSGTLARLSPAAVDTLRDRGVAKVFDLRSPAERAHMPTRWLENSDIDVWQLADTTSLGDPRPLLARSLRSSEDTRAMMRDVYRNLPHHHRRSYGALFRSLADRASPTIFHCSAGKDRTGVGAALLLSLLGVERSAIEADFVATNAVIDATTDMFLSDPRNAAALAAPREAWMPMMVADPDYLAAMFGAIEAAHGSVENYALDKLGLSSDDLARLRARLIQ